MLDFTRLLDEARVGAWRRLTVRLRCFDRGGADLSNVEGPFTVETDGAFSFSFSDVRLVPAAEGKGMAASPVVCDGAD